MDLKKLSFRQAQECDLPKIVAMLTNDIAGKDREDVNNFSAYLQAFHQISGDKNNFLAVVQLAEEIIATCHLTIMPSLTMQGSKRMNIEAVRVDSKFRSQGIGAWMMQKAIEFAQDNEVKIVQLTTNKLRLDAHRFYERLGFKTSHEGMKMVL